MGKFSPLFFSKSNYQKMFSEIQTKYFLLKVFFNESLSSKYPQNDLQHLPSTRHPSQVKSPLNSAQKLKVFDTLLRECTFKSLSTTFIFSDFQDFRTFSTTFNFPQLSFRVQKFSTTFILFSTTFVLIFHSFYLGFPQLSS